MTGIRPTTGTVTKLVPLSGLVLNSDLELEHLNYLLSRSSSQKPT